MATRSISKMMWRCALCGFTVRNTERFVREATAGHMLSCEMIQKDEGPHNPVEPLAGVEQRGAARDADSTRETTLPSPTDTTAEHCPRCGLTRDELLEWESH